MHPVPFSETSCSSRLGVRVRKLAFTKDAFTEKLLLRDFERP